jgi:non-ribosomal peptide synthetase component F
MVLDDLQLSVLVTQPHLQGRFAGCPFEVVALDAAAEDDSPGENPASGVTADHLAYIIYTSGSTGIPKGVVVKHRPAINLIEWVNRTFAVGPRDRVLFVNSLGFDLSVYDIFGLLAAGGSVRVASGEELRDPRRLLGNPLHGADYLLELGPGHAVATGAVRRRGTGRRLSPPAARLPQRRLDSAHHARLDQDGVSRHPGGQPRRRHGGYRLVQLLPGGRPRCAVGKRPYGKPIQNARYHVLDAHLQPVPVGVAGDLYIGGECLAEGYFKRPELNAQKFIADPFGRPGDRLYRTGDLARYWADGNLEFLGRVDHQVKVRGYRIELGEIEAVLSTREDIQEVLVVAGPDPAGGKRLIAYVVPKPAAPPARRTCATPSKTSCPST